MKGKRALVFAISGLIIVACGAGSVPISNGGGGGGVNNNGVYSASPAAGEINGANWSYQNGQAAAIPGGNGRGWTLSLWDSNRQGCTSQFPSSSERQVLFQIANRTGDQTIASSILSNLKFVFFSGGVPQYLGATKGSVSIAVLNNQEIIGSITGADGQGSSINGTFKVPVCP